MNASKKLTWSILAWETDAKLTPTGKCRFFRGNSIRKVIQHLSGEFKVPCLGNAKLLRMPDGNIWFAEYYTMHSNCGL